MRDLAVKGLPPCPRCITVGRSVLAECGLYGLRNVTPLPRTEPLGGQGKAIRTLLDLGVATLILE